MHFDNPKCGWGFRCLRMAIMLGKHGCIWFYQRFWTLVRMRNGEYCNEKSCMYLYIQPSTIPHVHSIVCVFHQSYFHPSTIFVPHPSFHKSTCTLHTKSLLHVRAKQDMSSHHPSNPLFWFHKVLPDTNTNMPICHPSSLLTHPLSITSTYWQSRLSAVSTFISSFSTWRLICCSFFFSPLFKPQLINWQNFPKLIVCHISPHRQQSLLNNQSPPFRLFVILSHPGLSSMDTPLMLSLPPTPIGNNHHWLERSFVTV